MRDAGNYRKFCGSASPGNLPNLPPGRECNYCYYMKPVHLKVARIGNSRGVRIPATTLERYHIGTSVVMEERSDGILLRPAGHADTKLSWDDTARAMSATAEDFSEWDSTAGDGLDDVTWDATARARLVAEGQTPGYKAPRRSRKR